MCYIIFMVYVSRLKILVSAYYSVLNSNLGNAYWLSIRDTAMKDRLGPWSHLHGDERR